MTPFVDFQDVWLAYNDELLAAGPLRGRGHLAADAARASSSPSSGPRAAASRPS
ncbi:MAG: hypothetical protein MZW92_16605 [Comamonadaceae bacterium]|nr:hypothetical protein [Comamonadaceae bacterium]